MADQLSKVLKKLVQRTSTNTGKLRTEDERAAFSNNVRADLASMLDQLNSIYYPLVKTLMSEQTLNALDFGMSGNVIKTHITADAAAATAYYDSALVRARTIKETIDVLLTEIARLESLITQINNEGFDDSEIQAELNEQNLNLKQLAADTMGTNYSLDGDGVPNLTYNLSQAVDALGALFGGWPTLGNTYTTTFPALSLAIYLSDVIIDTTLPETAILGLTTDLSTIRTFVGMDDAADSTPNYSAHGAITNILDGDSLERAIWKLDQIAGVSTLPVFTAKAILFGNGTNVPVTDATKFVYDVATGRLGLGTNAPEFFADIRGIVQHTEGMISRGGNARGVGASDFQVTRSAVDKVASGLRSFIAAGESNKASGVDSFCAGKDNQATNDGAAAFGVGTQATGPKAFSAGSNGIASGEASVATGDGCNAIGQWSHAGGRNSVAKLQGARTLANGAFFTGGDAQVQDLVVRRQTLGAGPFELFLDGAAQRIALDLNTSYGVVANVISRDAGGLTDHYVLEATIKTGAAPGTTAMVGAVTQRVIVEETALNDATIVADAVNDALIIQVTGTLAGASTRWVAHVKLTQVSY